MITGLRQRFFILKKPLQTFLVLNVFLTLYKNAANNIENVVTIILKIVTQIKKYRETERQKISSWNLNKK